jgi:hypothetical protein
MEKRSARWEAWGGQEEYLEGDREALNEKEDSQIQAVECLQGVRSTHTTKDTRKGGVG